MVEPRDYILHPTLRLSSNSLFLFRRPALSVDIDCGCTPIPDNPDVQGFVVRLSLFVSQVLSATLLIISDAYTKTVIGWIILQNYGLLLCAFIFLLLNKLSPNDIDFIIAVVHSPVFHYLAFGVITNIIESKSLRRSRPLRIVVTILLLGVFPIWIALSGITWVKSSPLARITCATRFSTTKWLWKLYFDVTWVYTSLELFSILERIPNVVKLGVYFKLMITMVTIIVAVFIFRTFVELMKCYVILRRILGFLIITIWGFTLNVFNLEANYNFQYGQVHNFVLGDIYSL
ncbi:hypothetical protein CPB86DRAFT_307950 [Serendipita vermifera]|nr:hypothetical protein CPB86DRAFT_307950 [Serendipita vermifera]